MEQWNEVWKKYSDEWSKLKTRAENIIDVYINGKSEAKLTSINKLSEEERKRHII
ncbi:hypothetical protein OFQ54_00975 [Brachyspira hyodysenteriae]|uniref:hypothetical protein n=1 Tax=Brachyspira hyodysenteriae TaxID=159 RepID=UPI0022CD5EDF|nr:hypothetical protein [Brachyspira hyodysenteriae]MCZ9960411.1 hypothetical protein [Brachyspira hyodysenteriae]